MWAKNKKSGFTVVELLIVVVVIAILASITIVSFNGITSRANNTKRISDLTGVAKSIELYFVENGEYPTVTSGPGAPTGCLSSPGWNCWGAGGAARFLPTAYYGSTMPQDPQFLDSSACNIPNNNLTRAYWYAVSGDRLGYILGTYIPNLSTSDPKYVSSASRACGSYINWMIKGGVAF